MAIVRSSSSHRSNRSGSGATGIAVVALVSGEAQLTIVLDFVNNGCIFEGRLGVASSFSWRGKRMVHNALMHLAM